MCGAACVGVSRWSSNRSWMPLFLFQLGRLIGYAVLGAVAAASMQALGWMTVHSAALRPFWSMVHIVAVLIGLMLFLRGEQPLWLSNAAAGIWHKLSSPEQRQALHLHPLGPFLLGLVWAFLPCGLLYSALLVALLSASPWEGAAVMSCFAVGGALMLMPSPIHIGRFRRRKTWRFWLYPDILTINYTTGFSIVIAHLSCYYNH